MTRNWPWDTLEVSRCLDLKGGERVAFSRPSELSIPHPPQIASPGENLPLRGYVCSWLVDCGEERTDEGEDTELDTEHGQVEYESGDERRGRRRGGIGEI